MRPVKKVLLSVVVVCLAFGGLWFVFSSPPQTEAQSREICHHLDQAGAMWALGHRADQAEAHLTKAKEIAYSADDRAWRDIADDVPAMEERCEAVA